MSDTDGQLALQAVGDAFQLEIARQVLQQKLQHGKDGKATQVSRILGIYSKGGCENYRVAVIL